MFHHLRNKVKVNHHGMVKLGRIQQPKLSIKRYLTSEVKQTKYWFDDLNFKDFGRWSLGVLAPAVLFGAGIYTIPMFKETRKGIFLALNYDFRLDIAENMFWSGFCALLGGYSAFVITGSNMNRLSSNSSGISVALRTPIVAFISIFAASLTYNLSEDIAETAYKLSKVIAYGASGFLKDVSGSTNLTSFEKDGLDDEVYEEVKRNAAYQRKYKNEIVGLADAPEKNHITPAAKKESIITKSNDEKEQEEEVIEKGKNGIVKKQVFLPSVDSALETHDVLYEISQIKSSVSACKDDLENAIGYLDMLKENLKDIVNDKNSKLENVQELQQNIDSQVLTVQRLVLRYKYSAFKRLMDLRRQEQYTLATDEPQFKAEYASSSMKQAQLQLEFKNKVNNEKQELKDSVVDYETRFFYHGVKNQNRYSLGHFKTELLKGASNELLSLRYEQLALAYDVTSQETPYRQKRSIRARIQRLDKTKGNLKKQSHKLLNENLSSHTRSVTSYKRVLN